LKNFTIFIVGNVLSIPINQGCERDFYNKKLCGLAGALSEFVLDDNNSTRSKHSDSGRWHQKR